MSTSSKRNIDEVKVETEKEAPPIKRRKLNGKSSEKSPKSTENHKESDNEENKEKQESKQDTKKGFEFGDFSFGNFGDDKTFDNYEGFGFGDFNAQQEKTEISKDQEFSFDNWGGQENELTFTWGDFDPKTYGSEAPVFNDQDNFETEEPVAVLNGALDTGDTNDNTHYEIECGVFLLKVDENKKPKYLSRGKGTLCVNTFHDESKKLKARILCRRHQVLSNILNVAVTKTMEFANMGNSFVRFSVLEEKEEDDEEDDDNGKKQNEKEDNPKTVLNTYLIKPLQGSCEILLKQINNVQNMLE